MNIRTTISTIVLVLFAITSIEAQVLQRAERSSVDEQPNKTLRYINPLVIEEAGRLADPTVIKFEGKYYLYPTGGIAWSSSDLVHWDYNKVKMPEGHRVIAPGAFSLKGYVYINGNNTGLYRSSDPLGPFEYMGDFSDPQGGIYNRKIGFFDPAMFVDDDGRIYLYYAGGSTGGVYGVELDSENPLKVIGPKKHFFKFETSHIWERYGSRNEFSTMSWIEGPWMTKYNGTYYLQYSAPGTDWKTYGVGVYTSKSPLGPFEYYEGSPILVHRNGLLNGVGHHSVVEGPNGTVWAIYTTLFRNWNRMFERRICMDPVGFDAQGNMFINGPSETPQWAPGIKAKPALGNDSGSIPLSEDKNYVVSSEAPGRNAPYAFDNNTRTWWAPAEDDMEPSLRLELGDKSLQKYIVDSARILFKLPARLAEKDAEPRIRQYKIEVSMDGETFETVVDKTKNDKDNAFEFDEITPVKCCYVRLTITGWPKDLEPGVVEFTVFGRPDPA